MATISKLPSGNWRAIVYIGKDDAGKQIRKSITRPTKREAEMEAKRLEASVQKSVEDINIKTAIKNYIDNSESTLSPSTISGYRQLQKSRYEAVEDIKISAFHSAEARGLINNWCEEGLTPKTIRNAYSLLLASLKVYIPDLALSVSLPKKQDRNEYIPTDEDIKKLLEEAKGTSAEIPIKLAAFCSLRRGEIAALHTSDIKNDCIVVSKSMVRASNGRYVIKAPKTSAGNRTIKPPKDLMEQLKALPEGNVTNLTPSSIYQAFDRARKRAGLPDFRFHALRHYFASSLHFAGIPDKYIMQMGGWESAQVLTSIYQHAMKDKELEMQEKASGYFDKFSV